MKKVRCQDVTRADCNFAFVGQTEDEVLKKAKEHAVAMHQDRAREVSDDQVRQAVKEMG